jgi:hypothetical protein
MRARLRIELTGPEGRVLAVRQAHNSVMRAGAELIANLFAGKGAPISHMGVGTSDAPETDAFATTGLTNDPGAPLAGGTEVLIPAEAFLAPEVDTEKRVVRVRVRASMPAGAAVGTVREAGLLARSGEAAVLYNRVTFAPIQKGDDHELTLFWEVSFPYGDLQWLM